MSSACTPRCVNPRTDCPFRADRSVWVVKLPGRSPGYRHPPPWRDERAHPWRRLEAQHGALLVVLHDHRIALGRIRLSVHGRQQARALNPVVGLDARPIENGRRDVERAAQASLVLPPLAGLRPDERHAGDALIVRRPLQQQPMIAEKVTMVGGEDDDRIVRQPAGSEPSQHEADRVVDHSDHPAAQRHRFAGLPFVDREGGLAGEIRRPALPLRQSPAHRTRQLPIAVVKARRQRHVLRPMSMDQAPPAA